MIEAKSVAADDGRWEHETVSYRVYFWEQASPPNPPSPGFWVCEPLQILGAKDVEDVLAWARSDDQRRQFTVYAEVDRGPNRGLVHIYGVDPTRD